MIAPERVPLTIYGHIIGYADLGPARPDLYGPSHELTNLELLPDDQIPEEAKPYVRMILATTLEGLSIDRTNNSGT